MVKRVLFVLRVIPALVKSYDYGRPLQFLLAVGTLGLLAIPALALPSPPDKDNVAVALILGIPSAILLWAYRAAEMTDEETRIAVATQAWAFILVGIAAIVLLLLVTGTLATTMVLNPIVGFYVVGVLNLLTSAVKDLRIGRLKHRQRPDAGRPPEADPLVQYYDQAAPRRG